MSREGRVYRRTQAVIVLHRNRTNICRESAKALSINRAARTFIAKQCAEQGSTPRAALQQYQAQRRGDLTGVEVGSDNEEASRIFTGGHFNPDASPKSYLYPFLVKTRLWLSNSSISIVRSCRSTSSVRC